MIGPLPPLRIAAASELCRSWREAGERVAFTNGVFDVLHLGHATYLAESRRRADRLIVGINSDASVRRLAKGPERPIHRAEDRAALLSCLRFVDAVVVFEEDTPLDLLLVLRPDLLLKGSDYDAACADATDPRYIVGSAEVRSWGGTVETVDLVPGHSTTSILARGGR
jgi:D-beta-D-heptose 7-phosphate kinase/D-beta-D-heptose 1-phosphate adenosyltransferase